MWKYIKINNAKEIIILKSLYVHIPFCKSKCFYCDFASYTEQDHLFDQYLDFLAKEMELYQNTKIYTIFIGGGTPSLLSIAQLDKLLTQISKTFDLSQLVEFTMECNPESLTLDKIKFLAEKSLVNRISLGLQAFEDQTLREIGRLHTFKEFEIVYQNLRNQNFSNINVDLIVGWDILQDKNFKEKYNKRFLKNLAVFLKDTSLSPEHISVYMLNIPEGTKLRERDFVVNSDLQVQLYLDSVELIKKNNYVHYEISNFAKSGYECKHNLIYWQRKEYLGLGSSAASFVEGVRYKNADSLEAYFVAEKETEILSLDEQKMEEVMLGLRLLKQGISFDKFYNKKFDPWLEQGFLRKENGHIFLTSQGIPLCNQIFVDLS